MRAETASRHWQVSAQDIEEIALGASVLGSGGGGSTYLGRLLAIGALERGLSIGIIPPMAVADGALMIAVAQVGTPMVFNEKLARGTEGCQAFRALEQHLGDRAAAVVCNEIGGINSITPLLVAAHLGVPVLDADAMGRAFPELYMDTLTIYGAATVPCAFCDDEGNVVILPATRDAAATERLGRAITVALGGLTYLARPVSQGSVFRRAIIPGSYTKARAVGRALRQARRQQQLPTVDLAPLGGRVFFHGLIVAVERQSAPGPVHGAVSIDGRGDGQTGIMRIEFQNEYLLARSNTDVVAVTPDVISLVDDETGEPISTEDVQVGQHVVALALRADARLTTPVALRSIGPTAFGYNVAYQPHMTPH